MVQAVTTRGLLVLKNNCIKSKDFALPFILFITLLVVSMLLGLISILFFLNNVESKKIKKEIGHVLQPFKYFFDLEI
jgi:hypothetical protein